MNRKACAFFFAALVASSSFAAGCASPDDGDGDDVDATDNALSVPGKCEIGKSCPADIAIVAAIDLKGKKSSRTRGDIAMSAVNSKAPRVMRQWTSGVLTAQAGLAVTLRGATPADAVTVDNFLLFEILDPVSGAIRDAAFAGSTSGQTLTVGGKPVRRIGVDATEHAAGSIDIASLLPVGATFKLRVSALDCGGTMRVGDVVMHAAKAPPPPPPAREVELSDPNAAVGHVMTVDEAAALIGPGRSATALGPWALGDARRTCSTVTGCTPWVNSEKTLPYGAGWEMSGNRQMPFLLPMSRLAMFWTGKATLQVGKGPWTGNVEPSILLHVDSSSVDSPYCQLGWACELAYTSMPECDPFGFGNIYCNRVNRTFAAGNAEGEHLSFDVRVGNGFYIGRTEAYRERVQGTQYDEVKYVLYGRTAPTEVAKLSVVNGKLIAKW